MRNRSVGGLAVAVLVVMGLDAPAQDLVYKFEQGQTLVYETRIEVDHGQYLEVFAGHPKFVVKTAAEDQFTLEFVGGLEASAHSKGNPAAPFRGLYRPLRGFGGLASGDAKPSEISLNARGRDYSAKGSSNLPYLLGDLSEWMLSPLPKKQEREWNKSRELKLVISDRLLPRPMLLVDDSKAIPTSEEIDFRLESGAGGSATIQREYRLATSEKIGNKPRVEVTGKGTLTFDRTRGLFTKLEYRQTLVSREEKKTEETPIQVSYQLLDEAAAARVEVEAKRGLNAEELAEVLADLGNEQKATGRVLALQKKAPAIPNPEVGEALARLLKGDDKNRRYGVVKALELWASESQTPDLLPILEDPMPITRHAALKALARVNPEKAAIPAGKMLTVKEDKLAASAVLKTLGAFAEPAVIPVLKEKEWQTRLEAIRILSEIGTKMSVAALEAVSASDENILNRNTAKEAIAAIKKRGQ
jgi:hypothetical protein